MTEFRSGPEPVLNSKGEWCGCADCRAEVGDTQFAEFLEQAKQRMEET